MKQREVRCWQSYDTGQIDGTYRERARIIAIVRGRVALVSGGGPLRGRTIVEELEALVRDLENTGDEDVGEDGLW